MIIEFYFCLLGYFIAGFLIGWFFRDYFKYKDSEQHRMAEDLRTLEKHLIGVGSGEEK
jgi:hypothetical protein